LDSILLGNIECETIFKLPTIRTNTLNVPDLKLVCNLLFKNGLFFD
jgi:hypothetical protein